MASSASGSIRIVLVDATHPGNIGAAARAMKTMCQDRLCLVRPKCFPSAEATARAAGADDILAQARVCATLQEALGDCGVVVGTSARVRRLPWPSHTPRELARHCLERGAGSDIAILFGRESSGLSNEELECCNRVVQIPANPAYSSLNLAAAVQLICYELLLAQPPRDTERPAGARQAVPVAVPLATQRDMELFYQHLRETMIHTGFYNPRRPRRLLRRVRRLFNRAQLDSNELNILRGFLSSVQKRTPSP